MKKILSVLLFVLLMLFSLTACEEDVIINPTVYIDLTSETSSAQDSSSIQEDTSSASEVTSSEAASSNVISSDKEDEGDDVDMTDPLVIVASWKTVAQTVGGEKKAQFDHKYITITQDFKYYPSNDSAVAMVGGGNYYYENSTLTVTIDGKETVWTVEMKTYDDLKLTKVEDGVTTVMEYEKVK